MFGSFNTIGTATQAMRHACRHAAEAEWRAGARGTAPAAPAAERRATLAMMMGGWLLAALSSAKHPSSTEARRA